MSALHDMLHERRICGPCAGSGEGRYDGSTCSACRGAGTVRPTDEDWIVDLRKLREEVEEISQEIIEVAIRTGRLTVVEAARERLEDIRDLAAGFLDGAPDAPRSAQIAGYLVTECEDALRGDL